MRTTEIGACAPPSGTTPGIRRPVRTITRPPISSRRIRFGEPPSSRPSGVIVAAFRPRPCSRIAAAASWTIAFLVARLDALVIPPAWRDVRISSNPTAKVQATGFDAAGRLQYLYHPDFRAQQDEAKYARLIGFGERLPDLRGVMAEHMDRET